jgi:hypothetical protein
LQKPKPAAAAAPAPAQTGPPPTGRINIELAKPDSALGSLIIDFFLLEGVHNPANYRESLKQAGHTTFHSARDYMRTKYNVEWSQMYTFFQEACMSYFSKEYQGAKIPAGPSQDRSWNASSFDKFCDAQIKQYGIDPVRLFLLKDIRPRQDTYRMAATLRRCEMDVQRCHKENGKVEAATATVLSDLRGAVLPNGAGGSGTPPFVEVWKRSAALQESSKTAREKVLQECFAEKRAGASGGDASGEYQSALGDLTALANRLWVAEAATVDGLAKGPFGDSGGVAAVSSAPSKKGEAEVKMEETLKKLTKLRDDLDDAQLKAQLAGLQAEGGGKKNGAPVDGATTARALRDMVQMIEARARRNKDGLASLEELKDEVAEAQAAAGGGATSVDDLDSAVALLGINDNDEDAASKSAVSAAQTARHTRLQAQLAKAQAGRAKLYEKKQAAAEPVALLPAKSIASLPIMPSQDNFTRSLPKVQLNDVSKRAQPEPEPEPEPLQPAGVSYTPPKLGKVKLAPAPALAPAPSPSSLRPAGLGSSGGGGGGGGFSGFGDGGGGGGGGL